MSNPQKLHPLTRTQQKSLHLWFSLVAKELNESGITLKMILKEKLDMDMNGEMVKEVLWRPLQKVLVKKQSTTELLKVGEIDLIYEHLNRFLAEHFKIHVPFPNWPDKDKAMMWNELNAN